MDKYQEPVTQYELTHNILYTRIHLDAIIDTTIEFLGLDEKNAKLFVDKINQKAKKRQDNILNEDMVKKMIDRGG